MTRAAGNRWVCEQCGRSFAREKSGSRPIRFCCPRCYHDWRAANDIKTGQFKPGLVPWNKDLKGIHLSPHSEYKKGRVSERWHPVGSEALRIDKNGKPRFLVKISEPSVWRERASVVWERENGPVPHGYVVHHKDRNSTNDVLENLQAMTRAEHIHEHRQELRSAGKTKA